MKTASDWQPNYIEDHLDGVGLYFVTDYKPQWYVFVRSNLGLRKIKQETPAPQVRNSIPHVGTS